MTDNSAAHEPEELDRHLLSTFFGFLQILWQRKWLIALGAAVGLLAGGLTYARLPPVYESGAQVLVVRKQPDIFPATSGDPRQPYYDSYLPTQALLIRSPLIVSKAVQKRQLGSLKSFADQEDPTGAILGALAVNRDSQGSTGPTTSVLHLSFRASDPEDCGTVLHAVCESYKDFLDETYRNVSDQTLQLITQAREILHKDLAKKEAAYRQFRQENALLWKGKDGGTIQLERFNSIESKRSGLLIRRAELQGQKEAIVSALQSGQGLTDLVLKNLPDTDRRAAQRGQQSSSEDQVDSLLYQEILLSEDCGRNHPQRLALRKRIDFLRSRDRGPESSDHGDGPRSREVLETQLQSLQQELTQIDILDRSLAKFSESERSEARKLIHFDLQDELLLKDLGRTQKLYDGVLDRLQHVNLTKDAGGYDAQIISQAGSGSQVEPKAYSIFSLAILLGTLAGCGLAYLADVSDTSFRTPEEIRRRLGLPVIGHIPLFAAAKTPVGEPGATPGATPAVNGTALDPTLCTYHKFRSAEAEAYRGLRTTLYFSTQREDHKVIQITSPQRDDGKSTLAANLAISIAQSGKQVVLVDADLRKPRQHKLFGLSTQVGLTSAIVGDIDLQEAIQVSGIKGLSLIPCGAMPSNPAELLTLPRFQELLATLREQFDFVVVDTSPLLLVTDAAVVASGVDGVLLILRVANDMRSAAERAKEILDSLKANVLGVVVNAVELPTGSGFYRYGHYSYRYGYSYNYDDDYGGENSGPNGEEGAHQGKTDRFDVQRGTYSGRTGLVSKWRRRFSKWLLGA